MCGVLERGSSAAAESPWRISQAMLSRASAVTEGAPGAIAAAEFDDRGQRIVVDHDGFRRLARLQRRGGDHRGNRLADEAYRFGRQRMMQRRGGRLAVGALEIGGIGNRPDARLQQFATRDDFRDPRHFGGGRRVDALDAGVRVRRAHEAGVELTRGVHAVGELAFATQQRVILDALDRFSAAVAAALQ